MYNQRSLVLAIPQRELNFNYIPKVAVVVGKFKAIMPHFFNWGGGTGLFCWTKGIRGSGGRVLITHWLSRYKLHLFSLIPFPLFSFLTLSFFFLVSPCHLMGAPIIYDAEGVSANTNWIQKITNCCFTT